MKQTAVELLVKEINKLTGLTIEMNEPCVIQAKEMEKEQIKDAWLNSLTKSDFNSADEYYNQTYKSEQ